MNLQIPSAAISWRVRCFLSSPSKNLSRFSISSALLLLAILQLLGPCPAFGAMEETLKAIQQSEFSFMRSESQIPFYPVAWIQDSWYSHTRFTDPSGALPQGRASQNTFSMALMMPAYVGRRDMAILGANLACDELRIKSGPYKDQSVLRFTPVAAWLRKFGEQEMIAAFAAPIFSKNLTGDQPLGMSGYAGIVGLHQINPEWRFLYGGVYEYSFGRHAAYPYLGTIWQPSTKWSLSLTLPWPTLDYAPSNRWLFQLGVAPGGFSWVSRSRGFETTQSFDSWNLNASVGYRLRKKIWLLAGVGLAGFRGLNIEAGDNHSRLQSNPGVVFSLALQFRP